MKKILILTNHSYMLYRFRRELIQALMEDNEVVLSMPFVGHEDDFRSMGLRCIDTPIDRRGINPKTDWSLFQTYRRLLKEEKPDMVITYSIKPNVYGGLACRLVGIPYCANVQGLGTAFQRKGLTRFVTVLYKTALAGVKTVFFENQANADEFISQRIISQEKITLLPGAGINLSEYSLTPYPANEPVRVLYLGRIMQEKGVEELFDAMERLGDRAILDLVGFYDDDYSQRVDELVAKGVAQFHGFQTDPRPWYAQADIIALPSYHEGMSNVLLEAAAIGRPLVTSRIPGCLEAVDDGVNGLLCHAGDADDLYKKLLEMVSLSPAQREKMGRAGHEKMVCQFDRDKVVRMTLKAIF